MTTCYKVPNPVAGAAAGAIGDALGLAVGLGLGLGEADWAYTRAATIPIITITKVVIKAAAFMLALHLPSHSSNNLFIMGQPDENRETIV